MAHSEDGKLMKKHVTRYYRKITERLPQSFFDWRLKDFKTVLKGENVRRHLAAYLLLLLTLSFVVLSLYALIVYLGYSEAKEQWLRASNNLDYWEEVSKKQENSPDAYYQAGFYAAELKDNAKARFYLDKALTLDPGFEKAKELRQRIN